MNILITAFSPFGGELLNASQEVLDALPERIGDMALTKLCLPVSFLRAPELAIEAAERLRPDAIVCLGQAGGRDCVTPERVAVNLMDAASPDNDGFQPVDLPVMPDAPNAFFSTLPVKAMVAAMQQTDVPAKLSETAGTYVCNTLMYRMLHWAQGASIPCGFIHIPYLTEQHGAEAPALPKESVAAGIKACLRVVRIAHYETLLDALLTVVSDDGASCDALQALRETAEALSAYYASDDWKRDFAADEAGQLPRILKRGVLSEDGIYNALETYHERLAELE